MAAAQSWLFKDPDYSDQNISKWEILTALNFCRLATKYKAVFLT